MKWLTGLFLLLLGTLCYGQPGARQIAYVTIAPSGACAATGIDLLTPNGTLYTCQSGVWATIGGGGGAATSIDAGGATSITNGTNTDCLYQTSAGKVGVISGCTSDGTNVSVTTQATTDNSTKSASTAYVTTAIANAIAAVNPQEQVQAATAAVLPNTPTYSNGVAGVGATLTSATMTALTVDGYAVLLNDRVLVKNQASALQNGIYTQTTLGTGAAAWVLTRAADFNTPSAMNNSGLVPVNNNGTANAKTGWYMTSTVATIGTDAVTFTQFAVNSANIVTASSPGVGLAHFAGSTQAVTSSLIVAADITSATITGTQIASSVALAGNPTTTTQSTNDNSTRLATTAYVDRAVGVFTPVVSGNWSALGTGGAIASVTGAQGGTAMKVTGTSASAANWAGAQIAGCTSDCTKTFAVYVMTFDNNTNSSNPGFIIGFTDGTKVVGTYMAAFPGATSGLNYLQIFGGLSTTNVTGGSLANATGNTGRWATGNGPIWIQCTRASNVYSCGWSADGGANYTTGFTDNAPFLTATGIAIVGSTRLAGASTAPVLLVESYN